AQLPRPIVTKEVASYLPAAAVATTAAATATTAAAAITAVATVAAAATAEVTAAATPPPPPEPAPAPAQPPPPAPPPRLLLRLVDAERAPVEDAAVHLLDRALRLLGRRHGDEREAARAAGRAIGHEVDIVDLAELRKSRADGLRVGVERQIAHIQSVVHRS